MAYLINSGAVLQVALIGKHENQQVMTVLHYRASCAEPIADGAAAANAAFSLMNVNGEIVDKWRECLSAQVVGLRAQVQWVAPTRYAFIPREIAPGEGEVPGDAYPVNMSIAITRRTEFAGRGEVGTIHMPGVPMDFVINGALQIGGETLYNGFGVKALKVYDDTLNGIEYYPIHWKRSAPADAKQLVSYSIKPETRVMRRRTVGLGS